MRADEFQFLSDVVRRRSGLMLTPDKAYLLKSRLGPVARQFGFDDLEQLVQKMRSSADERHLAAVTEAMTTNESFFFRDSKPFEQFQHRVMPELLTRRAASRRIRIWSAAASTGQEPYSLAIILEEMKHLMQGWTVDIIATDLSEKALQRARDGRYTQFEMQRGLPVQMLLKHFDKDGDQWRIKPNIRNRVTYRSHNLLERNDKFGKFDIVFCRNVLIYFDLPTKRKVLGDIANILEADGYLVLGGTETVIGVSDEFQNAPNMRGIYHHATSPTHQPRQTVRGA